MVVAVYRQLKRRLSGRSTFERQYFHEEFSCVLIAVHIEGHLVVYRRPKLIE